ncbi:hypothetical protein NX059_011270 [Plenodomus lindquistii]|nr:hypothetical protein NX059_011270 [Plenodomus lindquistii]
MPSATLPRPSKRLVVFCDGTWVGRETAVADAPPSNIRQLANMVGEVQYDDSPGQRPATVHPIKPHKVDKLTATQSDGFHAATQTDIIAGYQEGVGLNRTFLEYIWDGATASAIGDECISLYKFIVENYTSDHEIWLFGFSRGAFTVRCVAGMINNCGIIKRLPEYAKDEVQTLCYEIFRTYRSNLPVDAPKSDECQRWKRNPGRVWPVKRPIRFMGVIDTVGALGIPRLNAGIGFDWSPFEFFDQQVSSVVQHVYHAPALHDRLWIFQPCLVFPSEGTENEKAVVHQQWFPGTHYDVGRMTFRFLRQSPANWVEELIGWLPDLLSRTIYPNEVLSDAVLRYLVEGVRETDADSGNPIIPNLDEEIETLRIRLTSPSPKQTGSGDIYGDVLNYAPAGIVWGTFQRFFRTIFSLLNEVLPRLGDNIKDLIGVKKIVDILTATADRRIPGSAADVYPYMQEEQVLVQGVERPLCVAEAAQMKGLNEWGKERYASRTYENFLLWRKVFGVKKDA